jgi:hypothetical protein
MFEGEGGHEFICIIADTEGNSTSDPDYYLWDITDGSYDCDDHETVTLTGTHFDLYVVECNIGFLEQDASSFEERYEIPLHYKAISAKETPDDPNFNEFEGGAVHETVLASNREVHYSYPVTELIITDFVESYDSKYA